MFQSDHLFRGNAIIALLCCFLFSAVGVKAQVVINEIGVMPQSDGTSAQYQSMYNSTAGYGYEWIELYNSGCTTVDLSCWSIGGMDGGLNGGVFSFPSGTTIGPHSFVTLGGPSSGATFNLSSYMPANGTGRLWGSGATRWHIPNGDGWLILYNNSASFVDGVYWTFAGNDPAKISSDGTFVSTMTRPTPCGGGTLSDALTNSASMEYVAFTTLLGSSFARSTDGGATWMRDATPTLGATNATAISCPLPIELVSFEAKLLDRNVELTWQTASEHNNDYFVIERSYNGVTWEMLEQIDGAGNSLNLISYLTYDFNVNYGVSYYRLKQIDFDGKYSYSDTRSVNRTDNLMILPNPSSGIFGVGGLPKNQENRIGLYNLTGQQLKQYITQEESFQIDLSENDAGVYVLIINDLEAIKIIKQ